MKIFIIDQTISQSDIDRMIEKIAIACDISAVHFTLDDAINNFHNCIESMSELKDQQFVVKNKYDEENLDIPTISVKQKPFHQQLNEKYLSRCIRVKK